jgi:hypothetical protein
LGQILTSKAQEIGVDSPEKALLVKTKKYDTQYCRKNIA